MKSLNALLGLLALRATLAEALPKDPASNAITVVEHDAMLQNAYSVDRHLSPGPSVSCSSGYTFPEILRTPFKEAFCDRMSNQQGYQGEGDNTKSWLSVLHIPETGDHTDASFIVVALVDRPGATFDFSTCMAAFEHLIYSCPATGGRFYGGTYLDNSFAWMISVQSYASSLTPDEGKVEVELPSTTISPRGQVELSSDDPHIVGNLPLTPDDFDISRYGLDVFKCDPPTSRALQRTEAYKYAFEFCNSTALTKAYSVIDGRQYWAWQTEQESASDDSYLVYFLASGPVNHTVGYHIDECHVAVYSLFQKCGDSHRPTYYPGTFADDFGFIWFLRIIQRKSAAHKVSAKQAEAILDDTFESVEFETHKRLASKDIDAGSTPGEKRTLDSSSTGLGPGIMTNTVDLSDVAPPLFAHDAYIQAMVVEASEGWLSCQPTSSPVAATAFVGRIITDFCTASTSSSGVKAGPSTSWTSSFQLVERHKDIRVDMSIQTDFDDGKFDRAKCTSTYWNKVMDACAQKNGDSWLYHGGAYFDGEFEWSFTMTNLNPGAANVKNLESRAVDTNEDAKIAPRDTTATQGIIHCNNNDDQAVSSDEMSGAVTNFCERTSDTRLFGIASTTYSFPNFSVELSSTVPATGNWSYDVTKCTDSFWQILHSCQASSIDPIKHHGGSNDELNHIWKVSIQKKATDGQDAVSLADHEDVDATAAQRRIVCKGINSPEEITNYLNPAIGDFCRSKAGGQNQGRWVGWFKPANQKIRLSVEGPEVGTFTPGECEEGFFTVRDACHGTVGPGWSKGGVNFDGDWHWYTDIWDSWGDMKS